MCACPPYRLVRERLTVSPGIENSFFANSTRIDSMKRTQSFLLFCTLGCLACVALCSCGGEETGPNIEKVPTYPISGQVTVDGSPVGNILVKCQTVGESKSGAVTPTVSATTDAEGRFEIGTYTTGDGAPEGEYVLTFVWQERELLSGRFGGEDKLKGRYSDPKKSEIKVVVEKGKPNDLGAIALTTKD